MQNICVCNDKFAQICELCADFIEKIPQITLLKDFELYIDSHPMWESAALACVALTHPTRQLYEREDLRDLANMLIEKKGGNYLYCTAIDTYDDAYLRAIGSLDCNCAEDFMNENTFVELF